MHRVIEKLAAWHKLYVQLEDARARLREQPEGSSSRFELEEEISRLRQEGDSRLHDLQQVAAARRSDSDLHSSRC